MKIGIIGNPGSGKSTIFTSLTGIKEEHRESMSVGVVEISDERLEKLHSLYPEKKKVYSRIDILDEGIFDAGNEKIRTADAYLLIIGAFFGEEPHTVWENIKSDMIVADQDIVERRLKRLEKEHKKENEKEKSLLMEVLDVLEKENRLIDSEIIESEILKGYNFLTFKKVFAVINIKEGQEENNQIYKSENIGIPSLVFKGKLEADLQYLDESERKEYMELYGMKESAIARLVNTLYSEIGLITFFTVGKDEVRAWRLKDGSNASQAAGGIHSDMERGFIKAEVISIDELLKAGGEKEAKEMGLIRLVGKDYCVKDGDILKIRFA